MCLRMLSKTHELTVRYGENERPIRIILVHAAAFENIIEVHS